MVLDSGMTTQSDTFITNRQIYDAYLRDGTAPFCFRCGDVLSQGVRHNCRGYWKVSSPYQFQPMQYPKFDRTQDSREKLDRAMDSTKAIYVHDVLCNADGSTPIGNGICSCLYRKSIGFWDNVKPLRDVQIEPPAYGLRNLSAWLAVLAVAGAIGAAIVARRGR